MDVFDWLLAVTSRCAFVRSPRQALRVAPDLGTDAPPLHWIELQDGEGPVALLPAACTGALLDPLAALLKRSLTAALADEDPEDLTSYKASDWAADKLALRLARLLVEASAVSPRATSLPLLELSRLAADLLTPGSGSSHAGSSAAAAVAPLARSLRELDPVRQGEVLSQLAWALTARCGAAWGLAAQVDDAILPTRFYQAMVRSRLAFVQRLQDPLPPTELLLAALGLTGEARLLDSLRGLVERGIADLDARVRDGRAKTAERQAAAVLLSDPPPGLPPEQQARVLSYDPEVCSAYLARLSVLADTKQLERAGIDRGRAKQLLDPEAIQPIAAVLQELLTAVQLWDLVSGMQSLCIPADAVRSSPWRRGLVSQILAPRGDPGGVTAFVVALRVGELRESACHEASACSEPLIPVLLEAAIGRAGARARETGAVHQSTGSHELYFVSSAASALSLAHEVSSLLTPPLALDFGQLRGGASLPRGPEISFGIASGPLVGGTDGDRVVLRGACVDRAIFLAGGGNPSQVGGDPLAVRHASPGPLGIESRGTLLSEAVFEALQEEYRRLGRPIGLPKPGHEIAGVQASFRAYPVVGAIEVRAGLVLVFLPLAPGLAGSPIEVLEFSQASFRDFHKHDQSLEPQAFEPRQAAPASWQRTPPSASTAPPDAPRGRAVAPDPFADEPTPVPGRPTGASSDSGFSFGDPGEEEYEFDIEGSAFHDSLDEPSDPLASDVGGPMETGEVDGLDEGILVVDEDRRPAEKSHAGSRDDPFSSTGDDLGGFSGSEGDVFALPEDDAVFEGLAGGAQALDVPAPRRAGPSVSGDDSLFSFEEDVDDDPFDLADDAVPPVSSGGTKAAHPAPAPEAPAPAPVATPDDAIPLGYLPPAPSQDGEDDLAAHEVVLTPRRAPAASPATPRGAPAEAPAAPRGPSAPPPMPASLLALIGEEGASEGGAREDVQPPDSCEGSFSLIGASGTAPSEPAPPPQPVPPEDPWAAAFSDPAEAFAGEPNPFEEDTGPLSPREPDPPAASQAPAPAPPEPPADADPEFLVSPLAEDVLEEPTGGSPDAGAFESLFSDDGSDEAVDLDVGPADWSQPPAESESEVTPTPAPAVVPPPAPQSDPDRSPFDLDDQMDDGGTGEPVPAATLVPEDLRPTPAAIPEAPAPARPKQPQRGLPAGKALPDFSFMFKGYHLYVTAQNTVLFGHRYGGILLDVHEYPCGDDLAEAYSRFLTDKIAERFIPRPDLSRPAPRDVESRELDPDMLRQAFGSIRGG